VQGEASGGDEQDTCQRPDEVGESSHRESISRFSEGALARASNSDRSPA
jgi:hypothetical protein